LASLSAEEAAAVVDAGGVGLVDAGASACWVAHEEEQRITRASVACFMMAGRLTESFAEGSRG
jgi:hypothetical protein